MCVYIYVYIYIHTHIHLFIYLCIYSISKFSSSSLSKEPAAPPHPKTTPELEIMKFRSFLQVHARRNSLEVFRIGNHEIPKFSLSSPSQEPVGSLQNWKLWNSEVFFSSQSQEFAGSLQNWKLGHSATFSSSLSQELMRDWTWRTLRNFPISNSEDF